MDIISIDHHIAKVNTNADLYAAVCGDICITFDHGPLDSYSTFDRCHGAGELHKATVACGADQASTKGFGRRVPKFRPMCPHCREGAGLIP